VTENRCLLRSKSSGEFYSEAELPDVAEGLNPDATCGWRLFFAPIEDEL
jgi:hypothetical protein